MKRVLSGMRPTGPLHIGHLLGALDNWVSLQEKYDCFFMVADWHALMSEYENTHKIQDYIFDCVVDWLSCGIDPEKSTIFIQSHIREHLELAMIFSDITPLAWLERCPTYKEQLREQAARNLATYGFLGYPVLQAADILLYKADLVPVGEDQIAHLELTREIARRFSNLYKKDIFPQPRPFLTKTPRLLGTDNRKMSKTFGNSIAICDPPDVIKQKVAGMITDPERIKRRDTGHPDICNIYSYYKWFKPELECCLRKQCINAEIGCIDDKKRLAEIIIEFLRPIQIERKKYLKDRAFVEKILKTGGVKAGDIASETMRQVKRLAGLM